jgi:hypothetical protein
MRAFVAVRFLDFVSYGRDQASFSRMSNTFSGNEVDVFPVFHIDVIDVLRTRMLVEPPIDPRNAMCQYVVLV